MKRDRVATGLAGLSFAGLFLAGFVAARADDAAATEPAKTDPEFARLDADAGGDLSLAEYLAPVPEEQRKKAARDFRVMDFDRNEKLSPAEFQAVNGVAVPDPWVKLADAAYGTVKEILKKSDQNGDGVLSRKEWPAQALHAGFRPFGEIEFVWWDVDRDGEVTDREVRRMVDIAYGIHTAAGQPARWPDGTVLYWSHLKDVDRNEDLIVTKDEFVARHWLGKEKNAAAFPALDKDGDGRLTYDELTAPGSPFVVNLVATFYAFDKDLDGRLSRDELAAESPPAKNNPRGLDLALAAFDADGDGKYDLDEFRTSPLGALYITVQLLHKKDTNQDGVISRVEFHQVPKPLFAGIAWEVYRRYDRDQDGELSLDEYEFPMPAEAQQFVQQVMPEAQKALKTELRFFLAVCPLTDDQRQKLRPVLAAMLSNVSRRLAAGQKQMNRGFNANQPPQFPDAQQLYAQSLAQFAAETLSAEVAAEYRQEIEARSELRKRAAVLTLVARLDRELLLSEEQRLQVTDALLAKWQPLWLQQIEILLQNDQIMLQLPDDAVVPHLTKAQREVWRALSKSSFVGRGNNGFFGNIDENAPEDEDLRQLLPNPPQEAAANPAAAPVRIRGPALKVKALITR